MVFEDGVNKHALQEIGQAIIKTEKRDSVIREGKTENFERQC